MATKQSQGTGDERLKTILEQIGPDFIEESAKRIRPDDLAELCANLDEVRAAFSKADALQRFRKDGELMVSLLEDVDAGNYNELPYWALAVVVFTLRYVRKPIDIIPDSLPVIGQLDDAIVVSHGLMIAKQELHAYRVWKAAAELE